MKYIDIIENIIKNRKYVRNDIGMGRVQYSRMFKLENELLIIIVSEELEGPLITRIEKIIIVNDEIIVFYDGEYGVIAEKSDENEYKNIIDDREWDALFSDDAGKALEDTGSVSESDGFYAEIHETMEDYIEEGYDEDISEEICKHFNLV